MRCRVVSALLFTGLLLLTTVLLLPAHPPVNVEGAGTGSAPRYGSATYASDSGRGTVQVAPGYTPANDVRDLGAIAGSTGFDVAVGLAPQNSTDLSAYLTTVYLPGTSVYRHFLSAAALANRFGAAVRTVDSARSYFEAFGLTVEVSPDRLLLNLQGTAAEVGPAFGTSFQEYRTPTGSEFVSHSSPAVLPGSIDWTGAYGLGNTTPLSPATLSPAVEAPWAVPAASCTGATLFVPCQIAAAYDLNQTLTDGTTGAGVTIGIVDAYDAAETQSVLGTDLAAFSHAFALPSPSVNYLYPVPSDHDLNTTFTQWGLEEALDLQWAHATAPGAALDMTFSPNQGAGLYEAVDYLVAHQSVNVISMSWGEPDTGIYNAYSTPCASGCNATSDGSYAILDPVLEFAAAEGISVFAASGDCGSADGTSGVSTNFPASDPYVTGVGGTLLSIGPGGAYINETGWSGNGSGKASPGCYNQGGSGGGYAPFPRPWWQAGEGVSLADSFRGVPDVSAISVPGVAIYKGGSETGVGGTSLATPIWAGMAAVADQYAGTSLGFLNPALYAILRGPHYSTDFHDIRVGSNGFYVTAPGWDPVTGIGSPIVGALLPDLVRGGWNSPDLKTALNSSVTSGPRPLAVDFSVNATGGTGVYPIEGVYFGDNTSAFAVGGQVADTYTTTGVYAAQSYVVDSSGNISVSAPVAIVVGGGSALSVTLQVSNTAPAAGVAVTLTTTASGGSTPYSYLYSFGDGTFQDWTSAAAIPHVYGANGSFCAEVAVRDAHSPPNGGTSLPIPVAVGAATAPVCGSPPTPLVVTPNATVGVRDAPAEFPSLFHISGGSGTTGEEYRSSDPYVAVCGCGVFRAPGTYSVWVTANDSAGQSAQAETNVSVTAPLNASFATSAPFGPAPLTVHFSASATGGDGASAARTTWSFGDGRTGVGANAQETYAVAGSYWAVAHLSDDGHGNASEAFLIDVAALAPPRAPYLTATIEPAVDAPSGSTVRFAAGAWISNDTPSSARFLWQLGTGETGYSAMVNRTVYAPSGGVGADSLTGSVSAIAGGTSGNATTSFRLSSFFAVEAGGFVPQTDGLDLSVTSALGYGVPPVLWIASAAAHGPGTLTYAWNYGDGTGSSGPNATHDYAYGGFYTPSVRATDSWGDTAVDFQGVNVTGGPYPALTVVGGPSVESGQAPLAVVFTANATGGSGAPYAYEWRFGDGTGSSSATVTHTFSRVGTYSVNLTARDSAGGSLARSYTIVVSGPSSGPGPILGFIPRSVSLGLLALATGVALGAVAAAVLGRSRRGDTPAPTP